VFKAVEALISDEADVFTCGEYALSMQLEASGTGANPA
jgi:hypothetical protein